MIESDIGVLSAADLWNVEEFVTEFEREFGPVGGDNDSSGSGKISSMWVSADLRDAASAAKDALYSGMRLIGAAGDSSDSSNERLVGAFRDALHYAQSARDLIRPLAKEFIAARRSLNRPVPTIGTSKDACAVGLCATWAYSLINEFCHPEDDGKGNWGSTLILDPKDQRHEQSRNRLRGLPTPIRQEIEQEVDDELSAAEWLRQTNSTAQVDVAAEAEVHYATEALPTAVFKDVYLSPREWAEKEGILNQAEALDARLRRWRKANPMSDEYRELANRKPREPQFAYSYAIAKAHIDELKASGEA